jgi:hypothetical protein
VNLFDRGPGSARLDPAEFHSLAVALARVSVEGGHRVVVRSGRVSDVAGIASAVEAAWSSPDGEAVREALHLVVRSAGEAEPGVGDAFVALGQLAETARRVGAVIVEVEPYEKAWNEQLVANVGEWADRYTTALGVAVGLTDRHELGAETAEYQELTRRTEEASERRRRALIEWHETCRVTVDALHSATALLHRLTGDGLDAPLGRLPSSAVVVDPAVVDARLGDVRAALDSGGWGVRGNDLDRVRELLSGLSGPEADAVIAAMSDDELRAWADAMGESWVKGGWPEDRIRELEAMLGGKVSPDTWRRLARFLPWIDPDPGSGAPDSARDDQVTRDFFDSLSYGPYDGPLTTGPGDGFAAGDVNQGGIGDCWMIAGIQALAIHDPAALKRMIRRNPNGLYTVTFGDGTEVVVSADLPLGPDGTPGFAHNGTDGAELWPLLIEKAYAQRVGDWGAVVGGNQSAAIETLTGRDADTIPAADVSLADLADRQRRGDILGISTIAGPGGDAAERERWRLNDAPEPYRRPEWHRLVAQHAFIVTRVDQAAGTVTVVNPWNPNAGEVVLTEAELKASIAQVEVNAAP